MTNCEEETTFRNNENMWSSTVIWSRRKTNKLILMMLHLILLLFLISMQRHTINEPTYFLMTRTKWNVKPSWTLLFSIAFRNKPTKYQPTKLKMRGIGSSQKEFYYTYALEETFVAMRNAGTDTHSRYAPGKCLQSYWIRFCSNYLPTKNKCGLWIKSRPMARAIIVYVVSIIWDMSWSEHSSSATSSTVEIKFQETGTVK